MELKRPPIIKKNNKTLIIPRLIGLRVSDGIIALSVIFNPNKNPTKIVGKYASSIMYGVLCVNSWIWGANTRNNKMASEADEPNKIRLTGEKRRWPYSSELQLYIFEPLEK
jgi:hypothetical protein